MAEELTLEKPLAVVGSQDLVLGFSALGFKVYPIGRAQDLEATLEKVLEDKIAVCLIEEDIYTAEKSQINNYQGLALPIFIPFSRTAKTELLDRIIKEIRIKATGAF